MFKLHYFDVTVMDAHKGSKSKYYIVYPKCDVDLYDEKNSVRSFFDAYYVSNININSFRTMCREPAKALLYLKNDDPDMRYLAKIILICKGPVELRCGDDNE